jgi:hypothetical protein
MTDNQDLNLKPQVTLKDTTEVTCDNCKHNVFQRGIYLRKVSPLLSNTGKPIYIPIDNVAFYCTSCGHVNSELTPNEFKSNKIIR